MRASGLRLPSSTLTGSRLFIFLLHVVRPGHRRRHPCRDALVAVAGAPERTGSDLVGTSTLRPYRQHGVHRRRVRLHVLVERTATSTSLRRPMQHGPYAVDMAVLDRARRHVVGAGGTQRGTGDAVLPHARRALVARLRGADRTVARPCATATATWGLEARDVTPAGDLLHRAHHRPAPWTSPPAPVAATTPPTVLRAYGGAELLDTSQVRAPAADRRSINLLPQVPPSRSTDYGFRFVTATLPPARRRSPLDRQAPRQPLSHRAAADGSTHAEHAAPRRRRHGQPTGRRRAPHR